jgi:AP-2 complex subunit sigma-1
LYQQFKTYKIVYRRYAGLFFSVGIDVSDNELTALEAIHLFVEILDHYFSNVCELDLVFNFHKVIQDHVQGSCWGQDHQEAVAAADSRRCMTAAVRQGPRLSADGAICRIF